MKKLFSLLLVLLLTLCPIAAFAENWYVEKGIILAERMQILASDEAYVNIYLAGGSEDVLSHIRSIAESDFSAPVEARILGMPDVESADLFLSLLGLVSDETMPALTEAGKTAVLSRLPATFVSSINGRYGVALLTASSVLSTSETYIAHESFQPGVLLLQYPGEFSVAIAFSQSGEETVSASAMPIYTEFIAELTASENLSLLEQIGLNLLFQKIELI